MIEVQGSEDMLSRCLTDAVVGNHLRGDVNFNGVGTCHENDKA
ncbi:MAG: hypothetical protein ACOYH0_08835 [Saccharofermentanales bacterium]